MKRALLNEALDNDLHFQVLNASIPPNSLFDDLGIEPKDWKYAKMGFPFYFERNMI